MIRKAFATLRSGVRSSCRPPQSIEETARTTRPTLPRFTPQNPNIQRRVIHAVLCACIGVWLFAWPARAEAQPAGLVIPSMLFVTAESLDVHSTWRARSSGNGREGNPMMDVGTGTQAAIKAAVTVTVITVAAKLYRHRPVLARVFLYGSSAAIASVAAHNYAIARR